jgi:hypothetical protein
MHEAGICQAAGGTPWPLPVSRDLGEVAVVTVLRGPTGLETKDGWAKLVLSGGPAPGFPYLPNYFGQEWLR